jgi:hypothetical protein
MSSTSPDVIHQCESIQAVERLKRVVGSRPIVTENAPGTDDGTRR